MPRLGDWTQKKRHNTKIRRTRVRRIFFILMSLRAQLLDPERSERGSNLLNGIERHLHLTAFGAVQVLLRCTPALRAVPGKGAPRNDRWLTFFHFLVTSTHNSAIPAATKKLAPSVFSPDIYTCAPLNNNPAKIITPIKRLIVNSSLLT